MRPSGGNALVAAVVAVLAHVGVVRGAGCGGCRCGRRAGVEGRQAVFTHPSLGNLLVNLVQQFGEVFLRVLLLPGAHVF
ncbi:hypothetical protein HYQ46_013197 [Verticillium longisporum]|nr:hypothetical protein HYQ46_013197 [Verticillium longisporum]